MATRRELEYKESKDGNETAARDQLAALRPIAERVVGPEQLDTLAASDSLAYRIGQEGEEKAERDQLAALLSGKNEF